MTNHLWQTTLVVILLALIVKVIGLRDARVRYAIWLAASIKFLVPFSLFVAAGHALGQLIQPLSVGPVIQASLGIISQPFSVGAVVDPAAASSPENLGQYVVPTVILLWLAGGAVTLSMRWTRWRHAARTAATAPVLERGREVDALRRVLNRSKLSRQVTIRLAEGGTGPGLYGVTRPVLLWPAGLSAGLTDDAIDAIMTHELSHLRRADNLASVAHTAVEALFWFHPMVWWLGRRLVEDRERACDEAVLSLGTPPRMYAESLLNVCRFSLGARVPFVAGAAGSPLAQRVEAIMTYRTRPALGVGRRLLLIGVGILALLGPVAVGVGNAQAPEAVTVVAPAAVQHEIAVPVPVETAVPVAAPRDGRRATAPLTRPTPSPIPPGFPGTEQPSSEPAPGRNPEPQIVSPTIPAPPRDPKPAPESAEVQEFRRGALSTDTAGLKKPVVLRSAHPTYTAEALEAKLQGSVELEAVVTPEGRVDRVRVVKSLDPVLGLDAQAIKAALQWTFEPAVLNEQPVTVLVTLVMDFRLY